MKTKDYIGKKVWVLNENTNSNLTLDKDKVYTIVKVKPYNEIGDHCDHFIVKSENGNEKEIRKYYCIFIPRPELQGDEQIHHFLAENGVHPDGVYTNSEKITSVEISWGDWKHDHIWCDNLMGYLGYDTYSEEDVTEEDGGDCYSATHYYQKRPQ